MMGPAITHPTKHPMERRPVIQDACWKVVSMEWPQMLVLFLSRREGMAGLVYPITDPFSRQPVVAHRAARTCFLLE